MLTSALIETLTITSSLTSVHTLSPALTGSLKLHFASLGSAFVSVRNSASQKRLVSVREMVLMS